MATATLTDVGKNLVRDARLGLVTDIKIKYVALGTDSTSPDASDTTLGAESFRKAYTASDAPSDGESTLTLYVAPGEANFHVQEVGWFAGAGAAGTTDSGVLIARGLYNHDHLASEAIQLDFTLDE